MKKFFITLHPNPSPAPPNQSCESAQLCSAQSEEKEEEVLILFWCLVCISSKDFEIDDDWWKETFNNLHWMSSSLPSKFACLTAWDIIRVFSAPPCPTRIRRFDEIWLRIQVRQTLTPVTPVLQVHPDGLHISGLMDSLEPWIALEFLAETESACFLHVKSRAKVSIYILRSVREWKNVEKDGTDDKKASAEASDIKWITRFQRISDRSWAKHRIADLRTSVPK